MKKVFILLTTVFVFLLVVRNVAANYGQYGTPTQSYSIVVDKMVGKPGTSNNATDYKYVDNLLVSDPRFSPGQIVFFKIKIKNTSTTKLVGMEVKDTVPSYLDPIEGPGSYNSTTREITWNAGDFEVDQEKVFYIKMKVLPQTNLPADKGLFCVVNFIKANSANAYDDDTSQLCIEKQVTTVKTTPAAGPELGLILLAGNLLGVTTGLYLKKKLA